MRSHSRAKLFGHPIHPMLIVYPLGLLSTAVAFDIVHLITSEALWAQMAFWLIAAGVIGGLGAAVFGLIDWLGIPGATRAKAIGAWHGVGNVIVVTLFSASWLLRLDASSAPDMLEIILGFVGVGLALVSGWLGGELVDRLGVGVDHGANVDAPSSLSGRPATDTVHDHEERRAA